MHQIRFRLGLRPRHRYGNLQHSADPLAGLEEPTSNETGRKGRGKIGHRREKEWEEKGKGGEVDREGKGRNGDEGRGGITVGLSLSKATFLVTSLLSVRHTLVLCQNG